MAEVMVGNLQPRAQAALANSPIYELRDLRVVQDDGALLISGTVSTFYHKQLAQEVVRALCDHFSIQVVNKIEVR